ncbi:hypothetical protein C0416_04505 [bacterium]|nr:hypothetical protein [bacterium]
MRLSKLFSGLLLMALLVTNMVSTVQAATYEYIEGYGMVEIVESDDYYPTPAVDNSGTFGLSVEDFRYMCTDTGGEWDIVSGRHICYCSQGEFNYPFGCLEEAPYYTEPDYTDDSDYTEQSDDDYNYNYDNYDYDGFWDIEGSEYEWYIEELASMGIIKGYSDGSFRPDEPVTRAEMAKMVLMAANLETMPCDEDRNKFFSDLDNWQAPWVNAGYRMDIIEGYSGYESGVRLFKPNNNVNRVEGVKLVLAAFGRRPLDLGKTSFSDVHDWMVPWIEDAYRIGLIDRPSNGRFYPGDAMTRGMAAKVIVKMLQYSGDI